MSEVSEHKPKRSRPDIDLTLRVWDADGGIVVDVTMLQHEQPRNGRFYQRSHFYAQSTREVALATAFNHTLNERFATHA